MGGQGGGVLADWIVGARREQRARSRSRPRLPGVAQRTGATIYYIEMARSAGTPRPVAVADAGAGRRRHRDRRRADGGRPRDPARLGHARPHHADRLLRTAPSAVTGKGERRRRAWADCRGKVAGGRRGGGAKRFIAFDMQAPGRRRNGQRDLGLACSARWRASGALPFARDSFEATIRAGGKGIAPSLRGVHRRCGGRGARRARRRRSPAKGDDGRRPADRRQRRASGRPTSARCERVVAEFPAEAREMVAHRAPPRRRLPGCRPTDTLYLDRLASSPCSTGPSGADRVVPSPRGGQVPRQRHGL